MELKIQWMQIFVCAYFIQSRKVLSGSYYIKHRPCHTEKMVKLTFKNFFSGRNCRILLLSGEENKSLNIHGMQIFYANSNQKLYFPPSQL
jgi:hypothetical protein